MKIALAIPHLPDGGARDASMQRLRARLGIREEMLPIEDYYREFTEKLPNHEWAHRVWTWFASREDCEWGVQLQDDTLTPDGKYFWPILRAQLAAALGDVVGLATVHPRAPALLRAGHRWFRTRAWTIGWGVAYRTRWVRDVLLPWREQVLEHALVSNEDSFVNDCVAAHGGSVYHPIPSLVDHDLSLESTYASVDDGHRRSTVYLLSNMHASTFDVGEMSSPDFWRPKDVVPYEAFPDKKGSP